MGSFKTLAGLGFSPVNFDALHALHEPPRQDRICVRDPSHRLRPRASTDPSKLRRKSLDNIRAANDAAIAAPGEVKLDLDKRESHKLMGR